MNGPPISSHPVAPPSAPVGLRTGLLFLGVSVVTVVLLGWGVGRATARVAALEGEHAGAAGQLLEVERVIGGLPEGTDATPRVVRPHQ